MKAARFAWREWEEEQFLLLDLVWEKALIGFKVFYLLSLRLAQVGLFIGWLAAKISLRAGEIIFLSRPPEVLVRDEQWIFRHVK